MVAKPHHYSIGGFFIWSFGQCRYFAWSPYSYGGLLFWLIYMNIITSIVFAFFQCFCYFANILSTLSFTSWKSWLYTCICLKYLSKDITCSSWYSSLYHLQIYWIWEGCHYYFLLFICDIWLFMNLDYDLLFAWVCCFTKMFHVKHYKYKREGLSLSELID